MTRSKDNRREPEPIPTQLVLVTPALHGVDEVSAALAASLGAGGLAAVLARLAPADDRTQVNRIKALCPLVQPTGAALMIAGAPEAVARGGADGAHLAFAADPVKDLIGRLAPGRMVGVGGLKSRDDAMFAGEIGADYVMFGETFWASREAPPPPFDAVLARVAWWAEVFETPCIAYAADLAAAAAFAEAGADFVALAPSVWMGADPAQAVRAALHAIERSPAP